MFLRNGTMRINYLAYIEIKINIHRNIDVMSGGNARGGCERENRATLRVWDKKKGTA